MFSIECVSLAKRYIHPCHPSWRRIRNGLILLSFLGYFCAFPVTVQARSGLPGSAEFGFGGRLDPLGVELQLAINTAANTGMQWVGIDFDWVRFWPDPNASIDLAVLDHVVALATEKNLAVSIAITNPPAWVITPTGPDLDITAGLVVFISQRYAGIVQTVELFPGANTISGWGAPPHPTHYTALLQRVQEALSQNQSDIFIVAGGLVPLGSTRAPEDIDDLVYLSALYDAGAAPYMPILGIRLEGLVGQAKDPPNPSQGTVLRHYEEIRQVMINHNHAHGLIWITKYSWPTELYTNGTQAAVSWLNQALYMMKSQLYIGVAFFDRLNPTTSETNSGIESNTLVQSLNNTVYLHPVVDVFAQIIQFGFPNQTDTMTTILTKILISGPVKQAMKPLQP